MSYTQRGALDDLLYRREPAWWELLAEDPLLFVARRAFAACQPNPPPEADDLQCSSPPRARVVCISDTHNHHSLLPPLPPGDILIHAGDLTMSGTEEEIDSALAWLDAAPHAHKIVIAGNHDTALASEQRDAILQRYPSLTYLEDSSITLEVQGRLLSVYGNPRSPKHGSGVFQYQYDAYHWERRLPPYTDILVTHGPPKTHLDWKLVGCQHLLKSVWLTRPRLHVCGHIHVGRGVRYLTWSRPQKWYELACQTNAGRWSRLINTVLVVGAALGAKIVGRPKFLGGEGTILVNAASAGGARDNLRQGPIVVNVPLPER
ncbi:metallophosphoesterase domain-containing protein 1 [Dichomitus squalens]|nr:metallophosphoesterase domain-containing protein 1 [Dichomitus squalens]